MGAPLPNPPPAQRHAEPLAKCPGCGSGLIQPAGWKELPGGALMLHLRCPECLTWVVGSFEPEVIAELDDELLKTRKSILATYQAVVRANMEELADRFRTALELDLIGPDDFAPTLRG
jgi:hypothetical protein